MKKICNMGEDTKSKTTALWERIEYAEHVKGDVIICIQMDVRMCSTLNLHCINMNELHPCMAEIPPNTCHVK